MKPFALLMRTEALASLAGGGGVAVAGTPSGKFQLHIYV